MKTVFKLAFLFILTFNVYSQENLLKSGPMVGYSTMKEVLLWVQTTEASNVQFVYWNVEHPEQKYKTTIVRTTKEHAFTAQALADNLEPGNKYNYEMYINDILVKRPYTLSFQSQAIWKWRHDPPNYTFATGSCAYVNETQYDRPGTPYGGDYQIFNSIYNTHPNFMLWLGDNVYLRESDWNSKTGIQHRYSHTRSTAEMQPMLASIHNYAIWDDHDYGPNNSDRSYSLKEVTEQTFKDFFPNPNYIFDDAITGYFQWADSDFFLTDNRYWRTPNNRTDIERKILGDKQVEWLIDALSNSEASFKFIVMGGQFLNPERHGETYSNIAPKERERLLNAIEELKINGVIFLTGDIHRTELTKFNLENGYPIYDLTESPLTSSASKFKGDENTYQDPSTLVNQRNFGLLSIFGTIENRSLEMKILDSNGSLLWKKTIVANDLKFKD